MKAFRVSHLLFWQIYTICWPRLGFGVHSCLHAMHIVCDCSAWCPKGSLKLCLGLRSRRSFVYVLRMTLIQTPMSFRGLRTFKAGPTDQTAANWVVGSRMRADCLCCAGLSGVSHLSCHNATILTLSVSNHRLQTSLGGSASESECQAYHRRLTSI